MNIESGAALRGRLDVLEARGRSHLDACDRRDSLVRATSVAVRAGVIVPLLGFVLAFVRPVPIVLLVAGSILVPLLAAVIAHALRRRTVIDREAALALFDRRPGFKDRVAVSDEFLAGPVRGGFHDAAVAEAAPWLVRALEIPLDRPAVRPAVARVVRSHRLYLVAAGLLLSLALLLGRPIGAASDRPIDDTATTGVANGAAGGNASLVPDAPRATLASSFVAMLGQRLGLTDAARGQSDRDEAALPTGGAIDGTRRAEAAHAGAGAGAATAGAIASAGGGQGAAGRGGGVAGAGEGMAGRETGEAGGAGAGGDPDARGDRAGSTPGTPSSPGGDPARATPRSPEAARRAQERQQAATEAGQASANAPGSANPAAARQSATPPRPQSGDGAKPAPSRPSENGEREEQAQGNTPGQGSNTPGSAQDALKRSRGLSSLLLAVPTVDRLAGTPGAGVSRSTIRRVPPQSRDAGAVVAGARGSQGGDAGVGTHRPANPHDARLVRDYFARGDAGQGRR